MVKKKGCICWPTIKRTGRSLRTSSSDTAAVNAVVKETSKASQLLNHDEEEDAAFEKESDLQPSIPPEHDKLLEMLFPSSGRRRSRTLSLSISRPPQQQQPKDKRIRFRRAENPTNATGPGFRSRTQSSASWAGRRYPAPLGNDLLLLDMVPATPEAYTRGRGFLAATLPLGLRGGTARARPDEWPGYMSRLEHKNRQRCQCSGCNDDVCSSVYKYPAAIAAAEDEEQAEERMLQLGPFFDNESYYNTNGCCTRQRWRAAAYDQPMSRLERQFRAGLYDVPTVRHRSVLCSRHAFAKACLQDKDAYHYKEEEEEEGDEEEAENAYHQEAVVYDRPTHCSYRESYVRQQPECTEQSISKVEGGEGDVNVSETALDSRVKYDRPIEWSAKEKISGVGGGARKGKAAVVVCQKCFASELKSEEATAAAKPVWYQQMNALAFPDRNLRRHVDDESSYILSDRVETRDGETNIVDYIPVGQRTIGNLTQKGKGVAATKRDSAADGGYLTPLSLKRETMKANDEADNKEEADNETERESPLSMRRFLNEIRRKDAPKKEYIEQSEDNIGSVSPIGHTDSQEGTEAIKGQYEGHLSSSMPPNSDEEKSDSLQENSDGEKSSSSRLDQRKEAEGSSSLKLATDDPEAPQHEEGLEKETIGYPKNRRDFADAFVMPISESDNGENDIRTIGKAFKEEARRNDKRATVPPLLGPQSAAVSQLDLLMMSPPPQCAYMVNHPYMNVAENNATSVQRNDVVVVHREMCAADEEHDSYDTRQFQRTNRLNEFYYFKQKPKVCQKHFTRAAAAEEDNDGDDEIQVGRRQRLKPYVTLLNKVPSEYDFFQPYLPTSIDECHRNTCLAT